MKVDRDLIRHFGSGADPNDHKCMDGYNWFVSTFDGVEPVTVAETERTVIAHYDQGLIPEHVKTLCFKLATRLKNSVEAIEMGGHGAWQDEYRITHLNARGTLADMTTRRDDYLASLDPYKEVKVLKHSPVSKGNQTAPVNHPAQVVPGLRYSVFRRQEGRHTPPLDAADVPAAVAEQFALAKDRLEKLCRIERKIVDTVEDFEAWHTLT